jgi:hypothetical protein
MDSQFKAFFDHTQRLIFNRGKLEGLTTGRIEGKAEAVRIILKRRGLLLTSAQQEKIAACEDSATVEGWLERALFVTVADELFAAPPGARHPPGGC